MKHTTDKVRYTNDKGEMKGFVESRPLSASRQRKLGIPGPEESRSMRLVRKAPKEARINVRLSGETLEGLKMRAQEAGIPYQTLAASVLHMVAKGRLRLDLVKGEPDS